MRIQVLEPVIGAYAPDLIIVSAGFDAVLGDPLGGMDLSPELYGHLTERMARLAKGKLVLALEGGYNLRMTAECARQCMQVGKACKGCRSIPAFVAGHRRTGPFGPGIQAIHRMCRCCLGASLPRWTRRGSLPRTQSTSWQRWRLHMRGTGLFWTASQLRRASAKPGGSTCWASRLQPACR